MRSMTTFSADLRVLVCCLAGKKNPSQTTIWGLYFDSLMRKEMRGIHYVRQTSRTSWRVELNVTPSNFPPHKRHIMASEDWVVFTL